jgi:F-box interacting protein
MTRPQTFICEDIAIEIFLRLPLKSLIRFKCLSKYFESLISNQTFVKYHLQRSQKNTNLLIKFTDCLKSFSLVNDDISLSTIVKDFDFGSRLKSKYKVVGSCNGLVCLIAIKRPGTKYLVCLWNPSTKSLSYKASLLVHSQSWSWGCPPYDMFGFGYDSLSDTYKVVVVNFKTSNNDSLKSEVNVYNKHDNCWRNIQNFPGFGILTRNPGMYLNGTLNWFATSNFDCDWKIPVYIVSLDLGKETYKQLSLPSCFDQAHRVGRWRAKPSLGILKDRLCFSYDDVERTQFFLWQMNEYGVESSWTQLLKLSYQALRIDEECILPPLSTSKNDYLLLIESMEGRMQATTLYNQEDNFEIPMTMNKLWLYANDYLPSLVAP